MSKIKRFIDCYVPVTTCNFRCHYCYITHVRAFSSKLPEFQYSADTVGKSLSEGRLGGTCLINLCGGGETLLPPQMTQYIRVLLEQGHFVAVVTNGSISKRFDEIVQLPKDLLSRLFFKFSFHYLELKSRNLLDVFFNNIGKIRKAGCSFTLELTPSDELIPYIGEVKTTCLQRVGALCHVTVARDEGALKHDKPILTKYSKSDYVNIWEVFDSQLFDYKVSIFGKKRREFCYAGDWSGYLNFVTGELMQCGSSITKQNIYRDISKPIIFSAIGNQCIDPYCYNGHAWLTLGNIPTLKNPSYVEMRDRICQDGSHWIANNVRDFFSTTLSESNKEYSTAKKIETNIRMLFARCKRVLNRILYQ